MNKKEDTLFHKDELLEVTITDIGNEGEGIGKVDGYTLFIKDAVIGDVVKAKIMKAKKNYAYAHLESIVTPSPCRIDPKCRVARQCGGCQLQFMTYEKQLEFKAGKVRNNIIRLGGFDAAQVDAAMEKILSMDNPFRYRNKAQFPIGTGRNGQPVTGFYAERSHDIIPSTECYIGTKENQQILQTILDYMKANQVPAYDETTGRGTVRHVLIRKGFSSGEIMVCLVINSHVKGGDYLRNQQAFITALRQIKGMTSISVSINNEKTNVIMGTEIHTLWGTDTIQDTLCDLTFQISPLSFYQVNPVQAQRLYDKAIEYAQLTGKETVWDLYCGIGTITLAMARHAAHAYGVEMIPQAIQDAQDNARENSIENADFYVGKAEEVLPEKYEKEGIHADVIVVDPPRKGCDQMCLETMLKMQPDRIVYVSCDSATLSRDLRILCDGGYQLKKLCPADMFPWTVHVETVCLLSR
ncbi:MAG: 23S rRNA (uracil(1939)-C(5))-methyltransferase RlmD [Butyrivibrio sp.]|jgi:23S rRNA (uracil1939-C5)-methyltransferase|nr:23S rRNA (uracil(1939)-C(5))-methyltransferase RlmD [Butyrivibrio sp.]